MVEVRAAASGLEAPPPCLTDVWLTYNMYRREYVKGGGGGEEKENTSESEYVYSYVYSCVQECLCMLKATLSTISSYQSITKLLSQ